MPTIPAEFAHLVDHSAMQRARASFEAAHARLAAATDTLAQHRVVYSARRASREAMLDRLAAGDVVSTEDRGAVELALRAAEVAVDDQVEIIDRTKSAIAEKERDLLAARDSGGLPVLIEAIHRRQTLAKRFEQARAELQAIDREWQDATDAISAHSPWALAVVSSGMLGLSLPT